MPIAKEMHVPALGKHWTDMCSIRLQMNKPKAISTTSASTSTKEAITKQRNERTIRILKSNQHPVNACCVVHIKDAGME